MTTVTTTLVSGQNAYIGAVSSRGEYSVSVNSGVQGPIGETGANGVSITAANVVSGNLVLTFSNSATIDVGTVVGANGAAGANGANGANGAAANTGNVTFTNTTISTSLANGSLTIQTRYVDPSASPAVNSTSSWTFDKTGTLTFPDNTVQTTAYTNTLSLGASGYINFSASPAIGYAGITFGDGSFQNTAYTGTANNASYLGGVAAASYANTSGSYTFTGVHTYNANVAFGSTITISGNAVATFGNTTINGTITATGNITGNTAGFTIGYLDVPQNYTNTSFTIALTDRGKHIYTANGTSQTITIANNASVAFPIGSAISIVNQGAGTVTVARGSGVSMYLAANSTSADRSIATYGMATILKVGTDTWFINGAGVS